MEDWKLAIAQADLDDLLNRIQAARWPDQLPGAGWDYGVEKSYLQNLADHWAGGYDWRSYEARLNELPQFVTEIDGQNIHFLHVPSPFSDALPLLITHGWPSTVFDFLDLIGLLNEDFHLVIPSLPGFPFSGPTSSTGWGPKRVAAAWAQLMSRLGYTRYGAQGGDFGSIVAAELGHLAPSTVVGIHLNAMITASQPLDGKLDGLSTSDKEAVVANQRRRQQRSGYSAMMGTRPQTVAYGFNDSPVGLLAWNLEWFVDYDPVATKQTPVADDAILNNVSAFWLTGTAGSAARIYKESASAWYSQPEPSGVPTGVASFAGDSPIRMIAERSHRIVHWTRYDTGGHFASLQAPDLLASDIRTFFGLPSMG